MKPLTIEQVKGQKREFTFLGWKDDGLRFFATRKDGPMNGQPAVITPMSAYPYDSSSGEPYRFPKIVPLEIITKQFEIAWSDHHRDVLKRWRETKLAAVDAESHETLFPFDALKNLRPKRTPGELNRRRQEIKNVIESRYQELMETPLVELLDPIAFPYLLEDFQRGRWADEMGKDFGVMMKEAWEFSNRWHDAYDGQGDLQDYQGMLSALCTVRLVMRGDDKKDYPLTGVKVRRPTDVESQKYAMVKQLLPGVATPRQRKREPTEPMAGAANTETIIQKAATDTDSKPPASTALNAKRRDKPNCGARFENDFSLAVIHRRKGKPLRFTIEPELQSLLKRIIAAGGNIPRTKFRQDQTDTFQPEKLLRSRTAQALMKAGLLGSQRHGRTTVSWAKPQAD